MPRLEATPVEKAHSRRNVVAQLREGKTRTLKNKRVLRISCPGRSWTEKDKFDVEAIRYSQAFPPMDFDWIKHPAWGDKEYVVLSSTADRRTWEQRQKRPGENRAFTWEFDIGEILIDLHLTHCEAARFLESPAGEHDVLSTIGRPVTDYDPVTQEEVTLRPGFIDVVKPASGDEAADETDVGYILVGAGIHGDKAWKDVPQDYVEVVAQGRMGAKFDYQKQCAILELKRRKEADGEVVTTEPIEPGEPVAVEVVEVVTPDQCAATSKKTGQPCKGKATVNVDGKMYCMAHARSLKLAAAKAGGGGAE